jgi:cardiolipin synthase
VRRAVWGLAALVVLVFAAETAHRVMDVVGGSPIEGLDVDEPAGGMGGTAGAAGGADAIGLPAVASPRFAALMAALADVQLSPGHTVEIVIDAEAFDRMLDDVARARRSVTLQTYYCSPGELAERVLAALAERALAGIEVMVLADGFGCQDVLPAMDRSLGAAGAAFAVLRPPRWWALHKAQHRDHRRSLVIDGRIGYTGGFGIGDPWIDGGPGEPAWRETNVRVQGPAVALLQGTFAQAWAEATGQLPARSALFPNTNHPTSDTTSVDAPTIDTTPADATTTSEEAPSATQNARAGLLVSGPGVGTRPAERHLALSLAGARRSIFVANSYFVPPEFVRTSLMSAARRGVDVRILVPGPRTDIPIARWAGRGVYEALLEAGVRIWEYQATMMHAKTLVVDGVWVNVGSMNLDNRSLRLNEESALIVQDERVGAAMDAYFAADLQAAKEVVLPAHRGRSGPARLLEWLSGLFAALL